jgi:hypothetical protein
MRYTKETLRELCARTTCIAAAVTLLCACGQANPTHANGKAAGAAAPQAGEMEEVVITASRGSSPAG